MKIGFYAPLKSPNHPVPSGDRLMAQLLIKALVACGHEVDLLSELRSWDGAGSIKNQRKIKAQGEREIEGLINKYRSISAPDLVFTYHLYHKAPDWIGLALAKYFNIPYVVAEASFAPKQAGGPWELGYRQSKISIQFADAIMTFNPNDMACIRPLLDNTQRLEILKPFLETTPELPKDRQKLKSDFATEIGLDDNKPWLICVAMMRPGDKLASYKTLATSLQNVNSNDWRLIVIGDGASMAAVHQLFIPIQNDCFFAGNLEHHRIIQWLSASDLFVWPAINEAYGLALLEAQATGLAAVVQDYGGVATIVKNGQTGYVTLPNHPEEYVNALDTLIQNQNLRNQMGQAARKKFIAQHRFEIAVEKINSICNSVVNS